MKPGESRRAFLERLGAGALGGSVLSHVLGGRAVGWPGESSTAPHPEPDASQNSGTWSAPPVLSNPNILLIMVDQMRYPRGLSATQMSSLNASYLPNVFGKLRNNAYAFQNYYAGATACVSARATLMTGLYSPQTCIFTNDGPPLNAGYPTWGSAIQALNKAYRNVWWFGKWHLSDTPGVGPTPLLPYGFQTGLYPGGQLTNPYTGLPYYIPSPNGAANEGLNGGVAAAGEINQGLMFPSDAMIAGDFTNWLQGASGYTAPGTPWCATVSFINPHDIAAAPGAFTNPAGLKGVSAWFPSDFPTYPPTPPPGVPAALCTAKPGNYENILNPAGTNYVGNIKPSWQIAYCQSTNRMHGTVSDWSAFLNEYYWLQYYVDQQVGAVLSALNASPYANNTIVIFVSDHGEFGGSHGLHDKSGAVYEETIHVPLYVHFPGQAGGTGMSQMCSSVDFFGLMCDLATGGTGAWKTAYPDLANRESIWNYLYTNCSEQYRQISIGGAAATPYILHTVDETSNSEYCPPGPSPTPDNRHIIGFRTKAGGKLGYYSHWGAGTTCWDGVTAPEYEFYNYSSPSGMMETGNAYSTDPLAPQYLAALGSWGAPPWGLNGTGIIAGELDAQLSSALQPVQAAAQQAFVAFTDPCGLDKRHT